MIVEDPKKLEIPSGCSTERLTRIDFLRQIVKLPKQEPKKQQTKEESDKGSKKNNR